MSIVKTKKIKSASDAKVLNIIRNRRELKGSGAP